MAVRRVCEPLNRRARPQTLLEAVQHLIDHGMLTRCSVMSDIAGGFEELPADRFKVLHSVLRPDGLPLSLRTHVPGTVMVEAMPKDVRALLYRVKCHAIKTFSQYRADLGDGRVPQDTDAVSMRGLRSSDLPRRLLSKLSNG